MPNVSRTILVALMTFTALSCTSTRPSTPYTLDYDTPVDARLQKTLEGIDAKLRETYGMTTE
jgi:hypothetical protein